MSATSLAIINARLVDPASGQDGPGGVLIEDGVIVQAGPEIDTHAADAVIDAKGCILAPALIDLRCAKEPALTPDGETLDTLTAGAAAGGFGTIVLAPNARSPLDKADGFAGMNRGLARESVRVLSACGATRGLAGEQMAEIGLMVRGGAVYAGQGDRPIADTRTMRRLLAYTSQFDIWLSVRPADADLSEGTVALESDWSARMGLPAEPAISERIAIERDAALAELSGGKLMIDRLSTADGWPRCAMPGPATRRSRPPSPWPTSPSTRSMPAHWTAPSAWIRHCARKPTAGRSWRRSPTAISTPSSPTTAPPPSTTRASPSPLPLPAR